MDHAHGTMTSGMVADTGRPLIQWRAVFGGALLGMADMILMTSLWLALAYGGEVEVVRANLDWFLAGSAIFAMMLGGFLAGWLSGIRGPMVGLVNGSTVWALVLIVTAVVGVPAAVGRVTDEQITMLSTDATWTAFWALMVGFGAAAIGGMLGGSIPRRSAMVTPVVTPAETNLDDTIETRVRAEEERAAAERDRAEAMRIEREAERLREEAERRRRAS